MTAALFPRALLVLFLALAYPLAAFAHWDVGISVGFAPPELPLYEQPPCPEPGYIWTPGYWAYSAGDEDYYWVPGTWVLAPAVGLLWTPGYWAFGDEGYRWHEGYWGPHVGFYGGINYGFGYFGAGYRGGYWHGHDFYYNRAVTNVRNLGAGHLYNSRVNEDRPFGGRASFNGGNGGVHAQPNRAELMASREPHRAFTTPQRYQAQAARQVSGSLAAVNHGHPPIAATARPGNFNPRSAEPTRGPSPWQHNAPVTPMHASTPARPAMPRAAPPNESFPRVRNAPVMTQGHRAPDTLSRPYARSAAAARSMPIERRVEPRNFPSRGVQPFPNRAAPARPVPAMMAYARTSAASPRPAPTPRAPSEMGRMQPSVQRPQMQSAARGAPPARVQPGQDRRHS